MTQSARATASEEISTQPVMIHPAWEEIHESVSQICSQIHPEQFDVLLGVSVGGLVPTALFSLELGMKNVATISTSSYAGQKQGELTIRNCPEMKSLAGKRVLIIDDIVDSGKTVEGLKELLFHKYHVQEVSVAAIYVKRSNTRYPEYWAQETDCWIEFPWEVKKSND